MTDWPRAQTAMKDELDEFTQHYVEVLNAALTEREEVIRDLESDLFIAKFLAGLFICVDIVLLFLI